MKMCVLACAASLFVSAASAATIYSDDFSGSSSDTLRDAVPDVRPGTEKWFAPAAGTIKADGTTGTASSAWLPAMLTADRTYELTALVRITPNNASTNWFGLGFSSLPAGTSSVSMHDVVTGSGPWFITRQNGNWASFRGTGANNSLGNSTGAPFYSALSNPVEMKLILNTGTQYTLDASINGTQLDLNGAAAGGTYTFASNPTIQAVGFGANGTTANIDSFTFTVVPEPGAMALLGGSLILLGCGRRRAD